MSIVTFPECLLSQHKSSLADLHHVSFSSTPFWTFSIPCGPLTSELSNYLSFSFGSDCLGFSFWETNFEGSVTREWSLIVSMRRGIKERNGTDFFGSLTLCPNWHVVSPRLVNFFWPRVHHLLKQSSHVSLQIFKFTSKAFFPIRSRGSLLNLEILTFEVLHVMQNNLK